MGGWARHIRNERLRSLGVSEREGRVGVPVRALWVFVVGLLFSFSFFLFFFAFPLSLLPSSLSVLPLLQYVEKMEGKGMGVYRDMMANTEVGRDEYCE